MKILLTGASGFAGRNLAEYLAGYHDLLLPHHNELDLTIQKDVDNYFANNVIDAVIHAAVKPMHRNAKCLYDLLRPNLLMYYNLKRNVEKRNIRMLFIGSGNCYDNNNYIPMMKETYFSEHIPTTEEGLAKYAVSSSIDKSINIYDLRVFGLFGKYEDYAIRFISNAICKALCGMPITLRQNRRFSYLYVDDLAALVLLMLEKDLLHKSYNITPDESITLLELAEMTRRITEADVPILVGKEGMGMEYTGNNQRLRKEFPAFCFTPLEEAIRNLAAWYRTQLANIDRSVLVSDK
ncbi:NAD(P)-dependent oxidoreductase [Desulfovibrio sp. OttesenSCG-928-C14]|nr:NAD(P)-dependent oxidoreductase [Desulfovibrio sp. OttesenSCG-928-C14]